MDPQKAAPFELGRGDDAVLLLHGFTGSPWDVRPLGEALASRGYFVKGIRLPGHGQSPEAMLSVSWRDWEQAAFDALDSLSSYRRVFVSGLSMGGLLSVLAAAHRPERVSAIALMAPAVKMRGRLVPLLRATGAFPLIQRLRPWVQKDVSDIADPVQLQQAPILSAWPLARLADLWELQDRALAAMARVRAAALVMIANQDHVVDPEGGVQLAKGMTSARPVRLVRIEQGFHIMTRDFGRERVAREIHTFFEQSSDWD